MRPGLVVTLALVLAPPTAAQTFDRPDTTINAATRAQVIENVLRRLDEGYVFPQKATDMAQAGREREAYARRSNHGFERVERLNGNVGYLEIRSFEFDPAAVDSVLTAHLRALERLLAAERDPERKGVLRQVMDQVRPTT